MTKQYVRPNLIVLAAACALAGAMPVAHALPFTISASYNLGTSSGAGATQSPQNSCGVNGSSDALIFTGSGANNIGIHTYGCENNGNFDFGSRSSGENTYFVDGRMNLTKTFSGNSFSFSVVPGEVGAFGSTAFGAGEFQRSFMSFRMTIDGNVILEQSWDTRVDAGGALTFNALANNAAQFSLNSNLLTGAGYAAYELSGDSFTVNGLDANPHEVIYDIRTEAAGNILSASVCQAPVFGAGGGPLGGGEIDAGDAVRLAAIGNGGGGESYAAFCGAGARTGDPGGPGIARALPEPGSALLVGLGAMLLALARVRRRRQTAHA